MKRSDFMALKVVKFDSDFTELEVGECFLFGENVTEQRLNNIDLKVVSFYKIISKDNNVLYSANIETLED